MQEEQEQRIDRAGRSGGVLCLDFVNTVEWRDTPSHRDHLRSYADLVWWSHGGESVSAAQAEQLLALAERSPAQAAAVLEEAQTLREALYRLLRATLHGTTPDPADAERFHHRWRRALAHATLVLEERGWVWEWQGQGEQLEAPLWAIVQSAADVLRSPQMARVRQCANPACGWFFLDLSKNGTRRWCSMGSCGSRAKALQYYYRRHQGGKRSS